MRLASRVLTVVFSVITLSAAAQTDGLGSWNVISAKYHFNKRWSVFGEAQVRSQQLTHDFNYHEYKGGVFYHIKNGSLLLALGHYGTYQPTGEFRTPSTTEFRIWEQLVLNGSIGIVKLEHRYRVEQRFLSSGEYRNRFRYRINANVPIGKREIESGTFYASAYNEVFLTGEGPFFEQNRIFGGIGYQASKRVNLLTGIVHRFDNVSPTVHIWKNQFQLNLFLNLGSL